MMRTMRQAYYATDTLNQISGRLPMPERVERRERLLRMHFDGCAFGDLEPRLRSNHPGELVYEKTLGEKSALGHVLVGTKLDCNVLDVVKQEPPLPDFQLILKGGSRPHVELARVGIPPNQIVAGSLDYVRKGLEAARMRDPVVESIIANEYLEIMFQRIPVRRKSRTAAVNEIVNLVKTLDFTTARRGDWVQIDSTFPTLFACNSAFYLGSRKRAVSHLGVRPPPTVGIQDGIVDVINDLIDNKQDKVRGYTIGDQPLWLALSIDEMFQPASWSFGEIESRLADITCEPFDRILIGCFDGGFCFDRNPLSPVRHTTLTSDRFLLKSGDVV